MAPIGVYDSGFGGLTVLREIRRRLPDLDVVYLGDSGRAPYGGRDAEVLLDLSEQCVERLFAEGCQLVVVACHTVSSVALRHLQARYAGSDRRILGVTIPAAEAAVATSAGHIGWIATQRTVSSGTFAVEVAKLGPHRVTAVAARLLAPIVEEGWEQDDIARSAVRRYVETLREVDTLVLGCTHYPLLRAHFEAELPGVPVLDPAPVVAARLVDWLARHPGFVGSGTGRVRMLSTGDPAAFALHGSRFLGEPVTRVEHVAEHAGRLVHRESAVERAGQVVRPR
ncbi:MAG: glutamate racemase [Deltaproteobacteria bacterium]|nr:glutamate racemase [Deltaproteobacteria bacterium]